MKKLLILFLVMFLAVPIFSAVRKVDVDINYDITERLTSITYYYEDGTAELVQFLYDEEGQMYEVLPHQGIAPYTEENGATFPRD